MSTFGDDLIQSLGEALAHARGEGPATVHAPVVPREVRKQAKLTQAQMGAPDGHEPFRLPQVGTGNAARQRSGRDASARDSAGTRSRQARLLSA